MAESTDQCDPKNCKERSKHKCGSCHIFLIRVKSGLWWLLQELDFRGLGWEDSTEIVRLQQLLELTKEQCP